MPTLTEKRWRVLKLLGLRLEKLEAVPRLQVADRQAYERLMNAQATARLVKLARTRQLVRFGKP